MQKLNPILTYPESYNFVTTSASVFQESRRKSVFVSSGRITGCIFTQFTGPNSDSKQVTILATGDEALFGLLPDYWYKISWEFSQYKPAKFWTINIKENLAYELYTVSGEKAELACNKGCFKVYGFNFPIVLEMPIGGKVTITVELGEQLTTNHPLGPGDFCYEREYLYSNDGPTSNLTRVVSNELVNYNDILRKEYLSNYRGPCQNKLLFKVGDKQVLTVISDSTCINYANLGFIPCNPFLWLMLDTEGISPLWMSYTQSTSGIFTSNYGYVSTTGRVKVDFAITLTYSKNILFYDCPEQNIYKSIGMYSLNSKNVLISEEKNPVLAYPAFNSTPNVTFNASDYITTIDKQDNIYFGGYGLAVDDGHGNILTPVSITGTITVQYI